MLLMVAIRIYSKAHITQTLWWDDCSGFQTEEILTKALTDRHMYRGRDGLSGSYGHDAVRISLSTFGHVLIEPQDLRLGYGLHLWGIRAISLTPDVVHVSVTFSDIPSSMAILMPYQQLSSISVIYPVVILMVKLSILSLCLRLFKVDRLFLRLVYFGVIFQTLFYSAVFFVAIVTVTRCDSAAALTIQLCQNQYILVITQGVVNVITDFYVLALPITRVAQLQMPFWRKVGLCAIFLTGLV